MNDKSPIDRICEYQGSSKCNNGLFMKRMRQEIEANPDCLVWKTVSRIIDEHNGDEYLSRIWILREWRHAGLVTFEDMFDDAVFWYEKWREATK